jgi:putative flippase GtrA
MNAITLSGLPRMRREFLRFGLVGATAWVVDTAVFVSLKLTILDDKPVSAKVVAVIVATVVSYILNREWSFRTRGGRTPASEAALYFGVSAIAVGLYAAPLWISRYLLGLETPEVSQFTQEAADLVAGQIVGVLLGMTFRWWAFRRYVFPVAELTVETPPETTTQSSVIPVRTAAGQERADLQVTVLVPTRNEQETVGVCLSRLAAALVERPLSYEVLVVDDSDDATPELLHALAADKSELRVLHRPAGDRTGGLSGAITAGFASARGDIIVVMDADLQHPPEVVPSLVGLLHSTDADVCVASRYIDGGSPSGLDGPLRRAASLVARAVVHLMIPATRSISDPCGGFFAVRRHILNGATLEAEGFKILVEILARASWTRASELPYAFEPRLGGRSNFSRKEVARFARHMFRLYRTLPQPAISAISHEE